MKKWFMFCLLLLPLVAGCLTDSGDDDDGDNYSGISATDYAPLTSGTTYDYTQTRKLGFYSNRSEITTVTTEVSGPVSMNGSTYYCLANDCYCSTYNESWVDSTYTRIEDNILYMTDIYGDDVFIDFGATSWSIYKNTYTFGDETLTYDWTGKYIGQEIITVPAGTFNTVVFEIDKLEESSWLDDESTVAQTYENISTMWWAEGIGLVKSYDTDESIYKGELEGDDTEYIEIVLDACFIPIAP